MHKRILFVPVLLFLLAAHSTHGGEFRGRLLFGERPAPGVTVSAIPVETLFARARREAKEEAPPQNLAHAASGPDGAFTLKLPAAPGKPETDFVISVRGGGAVSAVSQTVYSSGENTELGSVKLSKGRVLSGRVVNSAGEPLVKARVLLFLGGRPLTHPAGFVFDEVFAATDENGVFRFEAAGAEFNTLYADAAGFVPATVSSVRAGTLPKPVVLLPGKAVLLRVVKPNGKDPAPGAVLRLTAPGRTRWVETAADGKATLHFPAKPKAVVTLAVDAGETGWAEERELRAPSEDKPLEIRLHPPAGIEGRVVERDTGKAVPRARVTAKLGNASQMVRSGADGRYRFRPLRPSAFYSFTVDEPRYVLQTVSNVPVLAGKTAKADIALIAGATVSGRVVDENRLPVAGAEGSVTKTGEPGQRGGMVFGPRAESPVFSSGPDGTFTGRRIPPGSGLRLTFRHPDLGTASQGALTLDPGAARTGLELVMRRGLTLSGFVRDEDEKPVSEAELSLVRARGASPGRAGLRALMSGRGALTSIPATSDDSGQFLFRNLEPGEYRLMASRTGFASATRDQVKVAADPQPEPLVITLKPGVRISGRVTRKSGEPAADAAVWVLEEAGGFSMRDASSTASDGSFVIEGLRRGQVYEVSVQDEQNVAVKRGVTAPSDNLEMVLAGVGTVQGRVLDPSGRPVPEFEVFVDRPPSGPIMIFRGSSSQGTRIQHPDGAFVLEGVPEGKVTVRARAEGYLEGFTENVVVQEGATAEGVEVRLRREVTLTGRVLDARSSRPVIDAAVTATKAERGQMGPGFGGGRGRGTIQTDADGRFEIKGLSAGKVRVEVRHPSYADGNEVVDLSEEGGTVDIKLDKGSSLSGLVRFEDGRVVADAEVFLQAAGQARTGFMGGGDSVAATDSSGRFQFKNLSAGRYTLSASYLERGSPDVEAVLEPGVSKEDVVLTLEQGATIRGTVTGLSTEARAGIYVSASGPSGFMGSVRTDANGQFEMTGISPGTIQLTATSGGFLSQMRTAGAQTVIAEGQKEASVEIEFKGESTLYGQVLRSGTGVPGMTVMVHLENDMRTRGSATTDDSGNYRIEGLTDGTYSVSVLARLGVGSGLQKPQSVKVSGSTAHDINLPMARVRGTVFEAGTRQPLSDVQIELTSNEATKSPLGRAGSGRTTTDSTGQFSSGELEPGRYSLKAEKAGYQFERRDVTAEEGSPEPVTIELTRAQGLTVEIRDARTNVPLRSVLAAATDTASRTAFLGAVALDSSGRGELTSLKPGSYRLWISSSGYAPRTLTSVTAPSQIVRVSLSPGGSLEIRMGPETKALPAARVRLLSTSGIPYGVDPSPDGWFPALGGDRRIPNVEAGVYVVAVEGGASKNVTVTEGGAAVVELP